MPFRAPPPAAPATTGRATSGRATSGGAPAGDDLAGDDLVADDLAAPRRLRLPPPYAQHWLPGPGAFEAAQQRAAADGAGTLLWHLGPGRLEFAVVLEPDRPLPQARLAAIAGLVALAEALAAHAPPERAITFRWPAEVLFDTSRIGGARLAVAPGCGVAAVPDWMVFGVELIADRDHLAVPGTRPASVSLREADFEDVAAVVESFAAHLMLQFDRWTHAGFALVEAAYRARLAAGETADLDALEQALARCDWRDAAGVRL